MLCALMFAVFYLMSPPFVVKIFALFGSGGEDSAAQRLSEAVYGPVRHLYTLVPAYRAILDWEFQLLNVEPE